MVNNMSEATSTDEDIDTSEWKYERTPMCTDECERKALHMEHCEVCNQTGCANCVKPEHECYSGSNAWICRDCVGKCERCGREVCANSRATCGDCDKLICDVCSDCCVYCETSLCIECVKSCVHPGETFTSKEAEIERGGEWDCCTQCPYLECGEEKHKDSCNPTEDPEDGGCMGCHVSSRCDECKQRLCDFCRKRDCYKCRSGI